MRSKKLPASQGIEMAGDLLILGQLCGNQAPPSDLQLLDRTIEPGEAPIGGGIPFHCL